jgi:hypothetical protein
VKWIAPLAGCLVLALLIAISGCGKTAPQENHDALDAKADARSGGEDLSTPEKTFEALKAASNAHDYSKMCGYFTPTAKKTLAAGMVMMGGFMQAMDQPQKEGEDQNPEAEQNRKRAEAVKSLLEKHGLAEGNQPKVNIKLNDSKEAQEEEMRKLADPIKDYCQFFADFVKLMREHGTKPDAKMIEEDAHMEDLKVGGDTATAEFVQKRDGSEKRSPIGFQKVDGKWLISEIPSFLN